MIRDFYTFNPGSVQQFIWFCKNVDDRRLNILINQHTYTINWEHKKGSSACCTKYFILHIPDHPAFYVLLEICLHNKEMKKTEFDICINENNAVTDHDCYITKLVDFLVDSSLTKYTCNEELLHTSCKRNKNLFVNYLLSIAKCDPNCTCNDATPLAVTTTPDIMLLLIQHGANVQPTDICKF